MEFSAKQAITTTLSDVQNTNSSYFLVLSTSLASLLLVLIILKSFYGGKGKNLPPGSLGLPVIGETLQFLSAYKSHKAKEWVKKRVERYGPVFKTSLMGCPTVILTGQAGNRFLFYNDGNIIMNTQPKHLTRIFGETGIDQLSGEENKRIRGAIMQFLKPEPLQRFVGRIDSVIQQHFADYWEGKEGIIVMLVYKNGTLTREEVRNRCANGSLDTFNELIDQTPPLNDGNMEFYYKEPEILPPLPVGIHHYQLSNYENYAESHATAHQVPEFNAASEVRAILEGQFISMRAHSERIGMPSPPERLIATGGASANRRILSLLASIFGCSVYTVERPDSASLGASLRAAHGWACHKEGRFIPISYLYEDKAEETSLMCKLSAPLGDKDVYSKYSTILPVRMKIEQELVEKFGIK